MPSNRKQDGVCSSSFSGLDWSFTTSKSTVGALSLAPACTETLEVINARLARAAEEASGMEAYDYLLINDDLDRCVEEMHQLIQLQHRKTSYHLDFLSKMREDLYHLDDKGFAKK